MSRMLVVILGLLILTGCVTQRKETADYGLCESEKTRSGKIRIVCHP